MTQQLGPPTLAEDLVLLLFQETGAVVGEETLPYVLAGAVLADLSLGGHVRTLPGWSGSTRVEAVAERPPADDLLRSTWDYLAPGPRGVQTTLAVTGPALRLPLVERLVDRGDLRRAGRTAPLRDGGSGRRTGLLRSVRDALAGDADPEPRIAALTALLSASGTKPRLHPEIPWTPESTARARQLEQDNWAADAAAEAVARTLAAAIVTNVILAAAVLSER